MNYQIPVPRSRGTVFANEVSIQSIGDIIDDTTSSFRDILVWATICRIASVEGDVHEFQTVYDIETDTLDLVIPDDVIERLTRVNLGPNIGKYFGWLTNSLPNIRKDTLQFTIGESAGIVPGTKGIGLQVGYRADITRADVFLDVAGDIDIDIWKCSADQYPPSIADSIVGTPLAITSGIRYSDSSLNNWSISLDAGDVLFYNVNAAATATLATIVLHVVRYNY